MGLDQAETSEDETDSFISADELESNLPDAFASDDDELIQINLDSLDSDLEDEDDGGFGRRRRKHPHDAHEKRRRRLHKQARARRQREHHERGLAHHVVDGVLGLRHL